MVCDFLAIYHLRIDPDIEDFAGLTGPAFWRYATRLPRYDGAVASRIQQWRDERGHDQPAGPAALAPGPGDAGRVVEMTPQNLLTDPLLSQFIEYG